MTTCAKCQVEVDHSLGQVWDSRIVYCPLHGAAPTLLEALQKMVRHCPGLYSDRRYPPWHEGCCATARAAIAAATGGQP